ncbi:MAG: 50S ribosomal L9 C-terminal domain-containing protein, partial [Brucella pseudogrignonensis]
ANGFNLHRNQVELNQPIKAIGLHEVSISLHPEVQVSVTVNIARSTEEAERQAKGEDLTSIEAIYGIEEAPLAEEIFDEDEEAEDQA